MGELDGNKGVWAYVQGGMGAVSDAIARSARSKGASVFVNCVSLTMGSGYLHTLQFMHDLFYVSTLSNACTTSFSADQTDINC